jgi:5-formyltetrahydrofolate cyclo-ligase
MDFYAVPPNWREHIVTNSFQVGQGDDHCNTVVSTDTHQRLIVLVPALAFTPYRQRLGRGKAFYDRYIAHHQRSHITYVGVCFSMQIELDIPYEAHDMVVDLVVTEDKRY